MQLDEFALNGGQRVHAGDVVKQHFAGRFGVGVIDGPRAAYDGPMRLLTGEQAAALLGDASLTETRMPSQHIRNYLVGTTGSGNAAEITDCSHASDAHGAEVQLVTLTTGSFANFGSFIATGYGYDMSATLGVQSMQGLIGASVYAIIDRKHMVIVLHTGARGADGRYIMDPQLTIACMKIVLNNLR